MTNDGVRMAVAFMRSAWPHSTLGPIDELAAQWLDALGDADDGEVAEALLRLRDAGREHAPGVGVVVRTVKAQRQGPPPSIDDAQRTLARLMARCVPYDGRGPEATAEAVAALAAAGVHESVLRFVAEQGIYAVRNMPDADGHGLDANQKADRRDLARHYRDVTLPDWRADPTPGLALERARRSAGALERGRGGVFAVAAAKMIGSGHGDDTDAKDSASDG